MQRWIVIGVFAMALLLGGGAVAYKTYKQNLPFPIWVPIPLNPQFPTEKQDALAKDLNSKLCTPEILTQVSKDLGLMNEWKMSSDAECAAELKKRIFVRVGEMNTPTGLNPTIDVGIRGKNKEHELSGKICTRLMADVWKILGIKPPPQKN